MTTIAYAKGVLAADRAVTDINDYVCDIRKIAKIKGYLIGACGDMDLVHWFLKSFKPEIITEKLRVTPPVNITDKDSFEAVIINPKGRIYIFTDKCMAVPVNSFGYFSIGSGSPLAMGALFVGADAVTAVKAAIRHDRSTGGKVQFVSLKRR